MTIISDAWGYVGGVKVCHVQYSPGLVSQPLGYI